MYQVVEMTDDEQREMYRRIPIKDLIEMLIKCNKTIRRIRPTVVIPCDHAWIRDCQNTLDRFICIKCGAEKPSIQSY